MVKISKVEPQKSIFVIFEYKLNIRKKIKNNNEYMKNCTDGVFQFFLRFSQIQNCFSVIGSNLMSTKNWEILKFLHGQL